MKKAFTLIEILIVIAIIGILAVAILIALDPVEQTNRANDVKHVTAQGEIRGAIQRYFASKFKYPWCATANPDNSCATWLLGCAGDVSPGAAFTGGCPAAVLTELQNAGELKGTISTTVRARVMLTTTGTGADYYVLFDPISKAESTFEDNGTYFTDNTCATPGDAVTCTGTSVCYTCIQ